MSSSEDPPVRLRNPRGRGERLRREILDAAVAILGRTGREDAVTLRAIARHIGIAAPSIYAHFSSREEILATLIADAFADLVAEISSPDIEALPDPVERLRAGCAAYLAFAKTRPQEYRVLFQNARPPELDAGLPREQMVGWPAFSVLVRRIEDCAVASHSTSRDYFADAAAVWVALHGFATLDEALPNFPWPNRQVLLDRFALTLARIDA